MINFESRLESLKTRRQGTRERAIIESMEGAFANKAILNGVDVRKIEDFEFLQEPAVIRYCVGAMKALDVASTQLAVEEGRQVVDDLIRTFSRRGMELSKFVQGAVALDTHVNENAPIEVVVALMEPEGSQVQGDDQLVACAREFRLGLEADLKASRWSAGVDCRGDFSISVEGEPLKRKVWVTPAVFYAYPEDEGGSGGTVFLYGKDSGSLSSNNTLRHVRLINERDRVYFGNLKRVIRLISNIIADMASYKRLIVSCLSDQDLACIAYNMNHKLDVFPRNRIGLVEQVRAHIQLLCDCEASRNRILLLGSGKKLFDSDAKLIALETLRTELWELASAVHHALSPNSGIYKPKTILNKYVG